MRKADECRKFSRFWIPTFVGMALLIFSCVPQNAGYLTLVNSHVVPVKINVDGRNFTLLPSNHITKKFESGLHEIRLNDESSMQVQVFKDRTTLYDSTGSSCFVVADFTERYFGGQVKIIERYSGNRRFYITNAPMITILGSYLPKKLPAGKRALRIQQIDCDQLNNDEELISYFQNAQ